MKIEELTKGQEAVKLQGLELANAELKRKMERANEKNEDLQEENKDLRSYIDRLLVQLLQLDEKAIERATVPAT